MNIRSRLTLLGGCLASLALWANPSTPAWAQRTVLVEDTFDLSQPLRRDLSLLHLWNGHPGPVSGFESQHRSDTAGNRFHAVRLTALGSSLSSYLLSNGLKTASALDYQFPASVDRNTDTLMFQWDLMHDAVGNSGEGGRMVFTLLHDYPAAGPQWLDIDSVDKYHPFGRPAYNIRIMNKNQVPNQNLAGVMMYGGGTEVEGESEIFRRGSEAWWLPGFSTEPGGFTPGTTPVYPFGGCAQIRNTGQTSAQRWRRFTWIIYPEKMELWVRHSDEPASRNFLMLFMHIPRHDPANPSATLARFQQLYGNVSRLPTLYNWFRQIDAFRIFWSGLTNASVANFRAEVWGPSYLTSLSQAQTTATARVQAYPNPLVGTEIHLRRTDGQPLGAGTYTLRNISGQVLDQGQLSAEKSAFSWPTQLPAGLYLLHWQSLQGTQVIRLVKP